MPEHSPTKLLSSSLGLIEQLDGFASQLAAGTASLSVVIPCYNEEESLPILYQRLKAVLDERAPQHEILFVDDGSTDGSGQALKEIYENDPRVSLILFRRNFGKAAALSAGFKRTTGNLVLMMDADLQDQPEQLGELVGKLDEGFDLVTGWKRQRHDPLGKTLPSKLFNKVVGNYFDLHLHDFNCGYKLMKGEVARSLTLYGDFHRFIPVLAAEQGFRVAECPVEHAPRRFGKSKYGFTRLFTGFLDFGSTILTTRFLNKPLQFFGSLGLGSILIGVALAIYLLVLTILGRGGIRPSWVVLALFILGGIQIICTGLLAELSVRFSHFKLPAEELFPGEVFSRQGSNGGREVEPR